MTTLKDLIHDELCESRYKDVSDEDLAKNIADIIKEYFKNLIGE